MIRRFNNKPIDQSKKKYVVKITAMLLSATMIPSFLLPVQAEDYSNEEEWYEKCTKVLTSQEDVKACEGFQQYQNDKKASLQQSIQSFQGSIDELTDDVEQMSALAQEQKQIKEKLEAEIKVQEEAIAAIEASIE